MSLSGLTLRIARPTDQLDAMAAFYREGLGLLELASFRGHAGFDGVILGFPGAPWHLELTQAHGHKVGPAPNPDHLLTFYFPEETARATAVARLEAAGHRPVKSFNPYWDEHGVSFEDPDGYRVVLHRGAWGR
ncbi:MAG: VOC family protein [Phenylobacterium sp.]|uniref:VOC family protein n=1 Tax=Phenylobacterium ferrooxidans TaxID=2982689 RepID=A0ABW6CQX5_9CAUL|nr:VOC family protein [Phenylobacterium sp.]MDO8322368.1 VOC family protein [Phenylobacterium sp.]MDO8914342.1 VOC family protein [Phenylobacterium sp.]MDO9248983.1 VOC family protein [Phenylobacterium sp.]MDP2012453.1 VOC family protein [Phenylobacterium sp.]MDP3102162.1 VOC family protein [Phenylobacterium sp.]